MQANQNKGGGTLSPQRNRINNLAGRLQALCGIAVGFVMLAGSRHLAQAQTYVCGTVGGIWTSNGSPYLVTCDILAGDLTIKEGVEVLFLGNYVFQVGGVLTVDGTLDSNVVFTRTNGTWKGIYFNNSSPGSVLQHCVVSKANSSAIRILNSLPRLDHCTIVGNTNTAGGGAGVYATIAAGELVFEGCTIAKNYAVGNGAGMAASLGSGSLTMTECSVTNNISTYSGYLNLVGGGIYMKGNSYLKRCIIAGNTCKSRQDINEDAYARGGGIYYSSGTSLLENCKLVNNLAYAGQAFLYNICSGQGGGVYVNSGSLTGLNTIVVYNQVSSAGGNVKNYGSGVYINSGTVGFTNCTVAYNSGAEAVQRAGGSVALVNSIVYFNNGSGSQIAGTVTASYCDIQNGFTGEGNINVNPIFNDVQTFLLAPGSLCIDAGNPDPACNDVCMAPCGPSLGTATNDMGAYGGPGACGWTSPCVPVIVPPPQYTRGCLGHSATLTVAAAGALPLTYQWYFGDNTPIPSATNACLTLSNLQHSHAGSYYVVVSNPFGSVASASAQLDVFDATVDIQVQKYFGFTYAGLNILGQRGATCELRYTTDLRNTDFETWTLLERKTITSGTWFYFDMESARASVRFYAVKQVP